MAEPHDNSGSEMSRGLDIDRRSFMSALAAFLATSAEWQTVFAQTQSSADPAQNFLKLSQFLTGRSGLDIEVAQRAFAQLTALDPDFPAKVERLSKTVSASANVEGFASQADDKDILSTARTIVSTWYLGYAGRPAAFSNTDKSRFVTFLGALMYEPTQDATVRPTYARGGTDYWIEPPPFVTPPPAPPGIRSWGTASPKGTGAIPGASMSEDIPPFASTPEGAKP